MIGRTTMGATAGTLVALLLSSTAMAQVETITVTSQKREQSIQDVPIAVSAYSGEFLEETGSEDVFDLQFYTPGLVVFQSQAATRSGFQIRGVGTSSQNFGLESSVGLFVDGVYRVRQDSLINDLVDIDRVEVLRGPQGTLFGKNSAAGNVSIFTEAPEFEFGGSGEVTVGNFGLFRANGAVTGPIIEDKLAMRLSGFVAQRDGFTQNLFTGNDVNDRNRYGGRLQFLFTPSDDVSVRVIADYAHLEEICCTASTLVDGPTDGLIQLLGLGQATTAAQFEDRVMYANFDPFNETEDYGISAQIDWDIPGHTITSITAWRGYESYDEIDSDFTSAELLDRTINDVELSSITQELRIANNDGGRLNYVAGVFFLKTDLDTLNGTFTGDDANTYLNATTGGLVPLALPTIIEAGPAGPGLTFAIPTGGITPVNWFPGGEGGLNDVMQEQRSWAIFGQADYMVTDQLTATVGLRWTSEKKDFDADYYETIPVGFDPTGAPAYVILNPFTMQPTGDIIPVGAYQDGAGFYLFPPLTPTPDVVDSTSDSQLTGTAKLSYAINDESMVYVSYGRGFKSGGFNTDRVPPLAPLVFDAETTDSYEIGTKNDFLGGNLRVNASAFYTTYDDFQSNTFVGTGFFLQNAGELETKGAEVEVFATPTDWLFLTGSVAYLDATYASFETGPCMIVTPDPNPNGDGSCDRSGDLLSAAPKWTIMGTATVEQPIGALTGFLRGEINYRTEYQTDTNNDPLKLADDSFLMNMRAGIRSDEHDLEVTVWVKNLTDEAVLIGSFDPPIQDGKINGYINEPRTYGASISKRF